MDIEAIKDKPRLQKYPAYQDSGVEWLGEIPEHWELKRLGSRFEERKTKVSDKDFTPLSVTKNGILPQLENAAKSNDGDNRKLVKKGDFVINSRSDRKGSSGVSDLNGSVSLINIVMVPHNLYGPFSNYLLKSTAFVEENYRIGHGIVADLWTTRFDEMKNIKVAFPPLQEQSTIANFLDKKCGKIETAIAQKLQLIELLKERKQIIIQIAVTKGLNPEVKMKDSGVEWIGEIPEHWEVKKIKFLGSIKSGYSFPSTEFTSQGIRVMKISNIQPMAVDWNDESFIDERFARTHSRFLLQKGDLVFALTRPVIAGGIKAAVIDTKEKILLNQRNAVLRPGKNLVKNFIYGIMVSPDFVQVFQNEIDNTGQQPNISAIDIGNLTIPIPPISEQKEISDFINDSVSKIDETIAFQQQQIKKLEEYKSSLIDAAVTGKIKVTTD